MTDRPQGPDWWQASDLKWYPPEKHPNYVAPPSPPPMQPPVTPTSKSGARKVWFTLAGTAAVLVTAALVAGRVLLGNFLPGMLLVAAIALIGATLAVRSGQSVQRKAMIVTAIVLVVAVAVPASSKVVYPAYHHFFHAGTSQASPSSGSPASTPNGGATPSPSSPRITSGILTLGNVNSTGKRTYGIIDPSSGAYSEVATFNPATYENSRSPQTIMNPTLAASPDLTKVAVTTGIKGQSVAGWIDTSGNFTNATPASMLDPSGSNRLAVFSIGFDNAGNFYYRKEVDNLHSDIYEVAAGSTTNARKIKSEATREEYATPWLDYDGSMHFGCDPLRLPNQGISWLGPNAIVFPAEQGISKAEVTGHDQKGCLQLGKKILIVPSEFSIYTAVASHDGTKVAVMSAKVLTSGGVPQGRQGAIGLYIAAADGSSQPTQLNLPNLTAQQLGAMVLLKWI
jgi:hypothetical protein